VLYSNEQLDLGDETFRITVKQTGEPDFETDDYVILRVIPEHLIVIFQPVPKGKGAVSPGFHAFLLNEYGGKTTVTGHMEHAALSDKPEAEAIEEWRAGAEHVLDFWSNSFIPKLKQLIAAA
jgi:hypothetical protein